MGTERGASAGRDFVLILGTKGARAGTGIVLWAPSEGSCRSSRRMRLKKKGGRVGKRSSREKGGKRGEDLFLPSIRDSSSKARLKKPRREKGGKRKKGAGTNIAQWGEIA